MVYGKNQFVTGGKNGVIITSPDAVSWSLQNSGTLQTIRSIVYGNDRFLATTDSGMLLSSPDGVVWSNNSTDTLQTFRKVIFGNSIFLSSDYDGNLSRSVDGIVWTSCDIDPKWYINKVFYINDKFIAIDNTDSILTSSDGIVWTRQESILREVKDIAYGKDRFVAVCSNDSASISHDGITWTSAYIGDFNTLYSLTFGNDTFVAVGNVVTVASPDGISWKKIKTDVYATLECITYADNQFIAVGGGGIIIASRYDNSGTIQAITPVTKNKQSCVSIRDNNIIVSTSIFHLPVKVYVLTMSGRMVYSSIVGKSEGFIMIPWIRHSPGSYLISISDMNGKYVALPFISE